MNGRAKLKILYRMKVYLLEKLHNACIPDVLKHNKVTMINSDLVPDPHIVKKIWLVIQTRNHLMSYSWQKFTDARMLLKNNYLKCCFVLLSLFLVY